MRPPKTSRVLVVDASVLHSASERQHPVSKACRDFLDAIRTICHRVVDTADLMLERKRHATIFSAIWFASMTARKKVVPLRSCVPLEIDTERLTEKEKAALDKDRPLLEAALAADCVLVTLDTKLKAILAKTRKGARLLRTRTIRWINPCESGPEALAGLSRR